LFIGEEVPMPSETVLTERPVLLYDGDCAFCTSVVNTIVRYLRPPVHFLPWQHVDLDRYGVPQADAVDAVQWVGSDGRRFGGAQAFAAVLCATGGSWWPVGAALRLPVARQLAAVGYRLIAANRHRLPGGTPACALPPSARDNDEPPPAATR
jgi:predicted DCC family thiol-disulfide oxidoreductase YuxK